MKSAVRGRSLFLALALCFAAAPAAAQVLPAGHWSRTVAARVDAARLTERGFDPAAATVSVAEVLGLLEAAAGRAEAADHPLQLQLLDWLARLRAEYPAASSEAESTASGRLQAGAGITAHQNPLIPRVGSDAPRYDADTTSAFGALRAGLTLGRRVHLELDVAASHEHVQLREGYAASRVGDVGVWLGRRRLGVISAAGGGMVMGAAVPWDGGGLWLTRPLRLPLLGAVHLETMLAAADSNGAVPEPWFWLTRGTLEPLPRFTIGITRAILFGDTAGGRAIDWGEFGKILIGLNSAHERDGQYVDNQLVAVDGRWRTPLAPIPLELYLTWGSEDSAGAWWKSPAIIGGLFVPALPGAPSLSIGLEHAVFTGASGHGHFYEHGTLVDGWAAAGRLIGHPLGGTGREWLLYGGFDRGVAGPFLEWRVFRRVRPPGNRLAPTRGGTAWGGAVHGSYDVLRNVRLRGEASLEAGSGWKTGSVAGWIEWRGAIPPAQR